MWKLRNWEKGRERTWERCLVHRPVDITALAGTRIISSGCNWAGTQHSRIRWTLGDVELFTWGPRRWGAGLFHWMPVWSHYEGTTEPGTAIQRTQIRSPWIVMQMYDSETLENISEKMSAWQVLMLRIYDNCVTYTSEILPSTKKSFCLKTREITIYNCVIVFKLTIQIWTQDTLLSLFQENVNVLPGRSHPCETRRNAASVSSFSSPKEPQSVSRREIIHTLDIDFLHLCNNIIISIHLVKEV